MNRPIAVGIGIIIVAIVGLGFGFYTMENDVQKETESISLDVEDVGEKLTLKLSDKVVITEKP